jgi:hypothetical protein
MSSSALWDKAVEPLLRAMTIHGGEFRVPGVAALRYEWEEDGEERTWVDIYGKQRPPDDGRYEIYRWADDDYGGAYWLVDWDGHLFRAIAKFMEEVESYDPEWKNNE